MMIDNFKKFQAQTTSHPLGIEVIKAEGSYIYDSKKKYLDLVAGVSVQNLGHCNSELNKSIINQLKKYSHVMHIVSNVTGIYDKKFSKFEALMAGFPAGTVSGATKIRAMEIIDELEKNSRKIYAGGIGYFSANGDFDTCIALRTAITKNNKFYVQAGAGIVADSKPINEYNETINKAKALIKSLEK